MALKALNERLSKQDLPASWPSMDETSSKPDETKTLLTDVKVDKENAEKAKASEAKVSLDKEQSTTSTSS